MAVSRARLFPLLERQDASRAWRDEAYYATQRSPDRRGALRRGRLRARCAPSFESSPSRVSRSRARRDRRARLPAPVTPLTRQKTRPAPPRQPVASTTPTARRASPTLPADGTSPDQIALARDARDPSPRVARRAPSRLIQQSARHFQSWRRRHSPLRIGSARFPAGAALGAAPPPRAPAPVPPRSPRLRRSPRPDPSPTTPSRAGAVTTPTPRGATA